MNSRQYKAGQQAHADGLTTDACPYPPAGKRRSLKPDNGNKRYQWMCGWLDAWTESRHGETFRRHGVHDDQVAA